MGFFELPNSDQHSDRLSVLLNNVLGNKLETCQIFSIFIIIVSFKKSHKGNIVDNAIVRPFVATFKHVIAVCRYVIASMQPNIILYERFFCVRELLGLNCLD